VIALPHYGYDCPKGRLRLPNLKSERDENELLRQDSRLPPDWLFGSPMMIYYDEI
jgi:hypothetical protein